MALEGGNSGGSGSAIRAGKAFVEFALRDRGVASGLDRLSKRFRSFADGVGKIGVGLVGAGTAVLTPLATLFTSSVNRGAQIKQLADGLGVATEEISGLGYAAELNGMALEDFITGPLRDFREKLGEAATEGGDAAEALKLIGLSAEQLVGMSATEQLGAVADGLAGITDENKRLAVALRLIPSGVEEMLSMMRTGSAGIKEAITDAADVGAIVDDETATKAREVSREFVRAWTAIKHAALSVGEAFLPYTKIIKGAADLIVEAAGAARRWITENRQLVLAVAAGGVAFTAAGSALIGIASAAAVAAAGIVAFKITFVTAVAIVKATAVAVGAVLGAVFSPVGLAIAAIGAAAVAAGYALYKFTDIGKGAGEAVKGWASDLWTAVSGLAADISSTFMTAWGGIAAAMESGDLKQAGKIALAWLNVEWARGMLGLTQAWNWFNETFIEAWYSSTTEAEVAWTNTKAWLETSFIDLVEMFEYAWNNAGTIIETVFSDAASFGKRVFLQMIDFHIIAVKWAADAIANLFKASMDGGQQAAEDAADAAKKVRDKIAAESIKTFMPGRKEQIEAERRKKEDDIRAKAEEERQKRQAARDKAETDRRANLERLKADLDAAAAAARQREVEQESKSPTAAAAIAIAKQAGAARGTFATFGRAGQMFGGADSPLVKLTRDQNATLRRIEQKVGPPRFK